MKLTTKKKLKRLKMKKNRCLSNSNRNTLKATLTTEGVVTTSTHKSEEPSGDKLTHCP